MNGCLGKKLFSIVEILIILFHVTLLAGSTQSIKRSKYTSTLKAGIDESCYLGEKKLYRRIVRN